MRDILDEWGLEYYAQNLIPSYLFIRTDEATIKRFANKQFGYIYLYCDRVTHKPSVVPDREIEIFRIVTQAAQSGLEFLDGNPEKYKVGDLVRVTDGPFKGAEGYVKRIKKDRRLVVIISGIAAVATSFIPPELLEKVENSVTELPKND
ncbi:MAG: UpxY family transcription antiterminator [Bacteroidales bacterium]|nr:UpxY family transcription antiterminator [Bacteroidales bacterium]